jgi:uncharacterized delta-60 repeat protein
MGKNRGKSNSVFRTQISSFVIAGALGGTVACAANGDLDSSFGANGLALSDSGNFQISGDAGTPTLVQPDGKILTCTSVVTGGSSGRDMYVARFTASGHLDPDFSFDGHVTIDFDGGAGSDYCSALALQPDGKIVVVGTTSKNNSADFAVARLKDDGTLDNMFGEAAGGGLRTGKTTIDFQRGGGDSDSATSVAIQKDGQIVVAGYAATASGGRDFAVVRLNGDGSRDSSFTLTGKVTLGFNLPGSTSKDDVATSVKVDSAGRVVLGGSANKIGGNNDFAIARLLSTGLPDDDFDADGLATVAFDLGGATGMNNDQAFAMT